ncbi:MAG TPA: histidine triad nucleotide-binding protein [Opitutales bacterium]|nr:histidine triad nucleotide-binding protein [Opitutales bacterium]
MSDKTLFQKIADGEIPARIEYQDADCFVIHDINPQAPLHLLVIPRRPIAHLSEAITLDEALLGHLLVVGKTLALQLGFKDGFRTVINCGPLAGETVPHLHVHVLAGRQLGWPPG